MVNHCRNLLLNLDGQGLSYGPLEEFTPPTYKQVVLSTELTNVRTAVFGEAPTTAQLLYRVRQLMMLLHETELEEFIYAFDPRVTYLPFTDGWEPLPDGLVVPDDLGNAAARLATVGEPALLVLFGVSPGEPGLTWKNLWHSNRPLPYRLGAAMLALAERTDETRLAQS